MPLFIVALRPDQDDVPLFTPVDASSFEQAIEGIDPAEILGCFSEKQVNQMARLLEVAKAAIRNNPQLRC